MSLIVSKSSGNLAADRRFAWGAAAASAGDHAAAADLFIQTLEVAPSFAAAAFALGVAHEALADTGGAIQAFAQALELDPTDAQGAALHIARLGAGAMPASAPAAYVRHLFDAYAPRFDAHLTGALEYRAPQMLAQMVGSQHLASVLDLGCGTGLAGEVFRAQSGHLAGCDLSPRMIDVAQRKNVYDRLAVGDIAPFLQSEPPASASLILAADVFVYIGDLSEIFALSHRALRRDGVMAFTVQRGKSTFSLGADMRFAHSVPYIEATAQAAGLRVEKCVEISTRKDRGCDVPGFGIMLGRA